MRFRLSSLLLFSAIVALCVAWFSERLRREAAHVEELENLVNGTSHWVHANSTTILAEYYFETPDEFSRIIRETLVWDIRWLWMHEKDIDLAYQMASSTHTSKKQAACMLKVLDCANEEEFFDCARAMGSFEGNEDIFPELFDLNSTDYAALHSFVSDSAKLIPSLDR